VVGTEARILYQNAKGRIDIALKFNEMVKDGEIGPVMLGSDRVDAIFRSSMAWDVMGGVARCAWAKG